MYLSVYKNTEEPEEQKWIVTLQNPNGILDEEPSTMNFINEMSTVVISEKIILPTGKFFWQNDGQLDDGQQDVGQEDPILNIPDHF